MKKNITILILAVLLSMASTTLLFQGGFEAGGKTTGGEIRADLPIRINNDSELMDAAIANGWAGDGSSSNPYIIENYHIDVGNAKNGIYLGNTTLYVTIRNMEIYNVSGPTSSGGDGAAISLAFASNVSVDNVYIHESNLYGIYLSSSSNILIENSRIENNTMTGSNYGIYINYDSLVSVENNTLHNSLIHTIGIYVYSTDFVRIVNNRITGFRDGAVDLKYSSQAILWSNGMYNCSVRIEGNSLNQYNHSIPINNTVNGKPVRYYSDLDFNNNSIPQQSTGELIFSNISNLVVSDMEISHGSTSFLVDFSHNILFENVTAIGTGFHSFFLGMSDNITIENSIINGAGATGIYVYLVNDLRIINTVSENSLSNGLYAYYSYRIYARNLSILNNYYGFSIYNSYFQKNQYVHMENCRFENNTHMVVRFQYALNILINASTFRNNGASGIELYGFNDNSRITNNILVNNAGYGIYSSHANNVNIENNTIINSGNEGIYMQYQGNAYVRYNHIDDSYGLVLNGINDSFILNNTIKNSHYYGIAVYGYSDKTGGNLIWGNLIENSTDYGIYLNSTAGNRIFNNTLKYNRNSGDSYDPSHIQGYDDTGNWWNSTNYGNYWADWTSPDNNNDGIVDNPYDIDGGAGVEDYYPLASSPYIPEFQPVFLVFLLLGLTGFIWVLSRKIN